jgi:hypothetical protein
MKLQWQVIFAEIRFAHDALPASKLGKKASTNLGAIQNILLDYTCLYSSSTEYFQIRPIRELEPGE